METLILDIICPCCGKTNKVTINDIEAFHKWQAHELLIQDAFPNMNSADRELLLSGICNECFNKMFNEDEEDYI